MKLFISAAAFLSLLTIYSRAHPSHARPREFGQPPILEPADPPQQPLNSPQKRDRSDTASIQTDPVYLSGRIVEVHLEITEKILAPAGKPVRALAINGTVPGPTLRFKEGDIARIHVRNGLAREETSLHWHGLLVPNNQDGVPHLTTPPIAAGTTFTYEFPLRQSGTYWFHSHTGLQEQRGVLGSIVVTPRHPETHPIDHDQVLLLTDWSNERPEEILRTLKRGSNWYGIKKGTAQSITDAIQKGELKHYIQRERDRMPPMDVSDIAYDAFLINGQRSFQIPGKPGDTVRLRVINGSAATYFYLQSATGPVTIIAADGPAVRPTPVERLLIGIAETYDVLVKVPDSGTWEVRATAQDGSGSASAFLGTGDKHAAPEVPKPNLYDHGSLLKAAMDEVDAPSQDTPKMEKGGAADSPDAPRRHSEDERPLSPYKQLRSTVRTTINPSLPRRTIEMHLTGDMQRYVWSFNGKTIDEESVIPVKRGEVLRLELINDSMMHHPIHLHGHFFRLLNGQGAFSPLKHTVDVPPMGRCTLEFEANEVGDWMFHCHILYHMMEGMARVFHYEPETPRAASAVPGARSASVVQQTDHRPSAPHLGEHAMPMHYAFADVNVFSSYNDGTVRILSGKNSLLAPWEMSWAKAGKQREYEADLLYERYLNPNWGAFAGLRLSNISPGTNRPLAGAWTRLPYLFVAHGSVDGKGGLRLELSKELQMTSRLLFDLRGRFDSRQQWQETVTASYTLTKHTALSATYHSDYGFGLGVSFRF